MPFFNFVPVPLTLKTAGGGADSARSSGDRLFHNFLFPLRTGPKSAGLSEASVKGGHFLADQLTLFKPGGQIMPLTLQLAPPYCHST